MPNSESTVLLSRSITFGAQTISIVTLRPPTLKELDDIGVPAERTSFEGGCFWYEHIYWDRLGELIQRCIVSPADATAWLGQVSAADTYRLISAIGHLLVATENAAARVTRGIEINP